MILFAGFIAKTEAVREFGFDTKLNYLNAIKLSVELARKYHYHFIPEVLCGYRWHEENVCQLKDIKGWADDGIVFREYFLREFGDRFPKDSSQQKWVFGMTTNLIAREYFLREFGRRLPKHSYQRSWAFAFTYYLTAQAESPEFLQRCTDDTDTVVRLFHHLARNKSLLRRFWDSPAEVLDRYELGEESRQVLLNVDNVLGSKNVESLLFRGSSAIFLDLIHSRRS